MKDFDQTHALLSGITSIWGRILMFFVAGIVGHVGGVIAELAAQQSLFSFEMSAPVLALVPLSFFWHILQDMTTGLGLLFVLLLVTSFVLFAFTELPLAD